jgi:hypothetical protein
MPDRLDFYKKICYNIKKTHFYRSALVNSGEHMRTDRSPTGVRFTGKSRPYERSLEVAKNLHMGYTDRKFGPGRPSPAR